MPKKRKKKKTIGSMSNSRGKWGINPVTKVKDNKKRKNDRKKVKEKIKNGDEI